VEESLLASRRGTPTWVKVALGCGAALLGVAVMVLVLITALASALREARSKSMEIGAMRNLKAYAAGQEQYRLLRGEFAASASSLVEEKGADGRALCLIPGGVAASGRKGGSACGGYRFRELRSLGGKPVDWSSQFALCAVPAGEVEGAAGRRAFVIRTDGAIWAKQWPEGSGFVTDFPADPPARGWKRTE
jgi:hypothetical protein